MKLKEFNTENTASSKHTVPYFSVYKTGCFSISKATCELLSLKVGDQIVFLQDEDEDENWYIEKASENGFALRECKTTSRGLLFNNRCLAKKIMFEMDLNGSVNSYRFLIAGKPTEFEKRKLFGVLKLSAE